MEARLVTNESAGDLGFSVYDRRWCTNGAAAVSSGQLVLSYFRLDRPRIAASIGTFTGTTPAAATPTLCRLGLYREEADGSLTKIAQTNNNTALWSGSLVHYVENFTTAVQLDPAVRYATAAICVTGVAAPQIACMNFASAAVAQRPPRSCALVASQTDLLDTISVSQLTAVLASRAYYAEIYPVTASGVQLFNE